MYSCLGFSHSRFYAQSIAALVTAMGRETLQRTVTIAEETVGLDVIYGDTDSIMINTRISGKDLEQLPVVNKLGNQVKSEVNKLYRTLELEIDGVFRSMLLLKKKKFAAVTIKLLPDGSTQVGKEMKGLDLVRRDWCIESKDTGKYVLDQILSGEDREEVISKIHEDIFCDSLTQKSFLDSNRNNRFGCHSSKSKLYFVDHVTRFFRNNFYAHPTCDNANIILSSTCLFEWECIFKYGFK